MKEHSMSYFDSQVKQHSKVSSIATRLCYLLDKLTVLYVLQQVG